MDEIFGLAVGVIGLDISSFWNLTPREFSFISSAYAGKVEDQLRSDWEQTRIISYYIYCSYPKKGRNPSMNTFKKDHMPFGWDVIKKDDDELPDAEEVVSINEWSKRLEQIKNSGKVEKKLSAIEAKNI